MKNLRITLILLLVTVTLSCNKDDEQNEISAAQTPEFTATINGGGFTNYAFDLGVYAITKGTGSNTLSIDIADTSGVNVNLFLNGTDGFETGTIKQMGNVDSNSYTTNSIIRNTQGVTYFSSSGRVSITNNRAHPTESGARLLSGTFIITATTIDGGNSTNLIGSFSELKY